jgi:DNA-binding response OmpR family regulator
LPWEGPEAREAAAHTLLIAEDEPDVSDLLSEQLHADGFTTEVAEDGVHALAMAESNEFDLLVLDLGMPGKDGLSVLRGLRARGNTMPIVIVSSAQAPDGHRRGPREGRGRLHTQALRRR